MGGYLRVNYRLTGGKVFADDIGSLLVKFRETVVWDSADTGLTLSMKGYGCPSWIMPPQFHGMPTHIIYIHHSLAAADSVVYVSIFAYSGALTNGMYAGTLALTQSMIVDYVALIGSRP